MKTKAETQDGQITEMERAFLECAIWSSTDENGRPLDKDSTIEDIDPRSLRDLRSELADFCEANSDLLCESGLSDSKIGHDFWLTKNRHGAGFWDRGLGSIGIRLADSARAWGSNYLVRDHDGTIYSD